MCLCSLHNTCPRTSRAAPYLEAALDHPPAHEALGAAHEEEQAQARAEWPVESPPRREDDGRHSEDEAQDAAPHAVPVLHPEDEFEVLHRAMRAREVREGWCAGFADGCSQ